MRLRSLIVLALLALVLPAASAGAAKPKHVRIVKHQGAYAAVLTYADRPASDSFTPVSDVTLRIRYRGHLVLRRQICQLESPVYGGCRWGEAIAFDLVRVGPHDTPAFLLDLWNGGDRCCDESFIAVAGGRIAWITREWSGADGWVGAGARRLRGRTIFETGDGRFFCSFSVCAGATVPIRVFAIDRYDSFVNVTRSFPGLIRANARELATGGGNPHMSIRKQGSGVVAAWCADEYLLGNGARCSRVLTYDAEHHWSKKMAGAIPGRGFARSLNRELKRWGYKR